MASCEEPLSLREVLDSAQDLTATGVWLNGLAEEIYNQLPYYPPQERARRAAVARAVVESLIVFGKESPYMPVWSAGSRGAESPREVDCAYIMLDLWRAEIYEDEALAERLRKALPPDVTAKWEATADCWRRPHPIEVKVPETWWRCDSCGASSDVGEQEAVAVTSRDGHSEIGYDIYYCLDCIRMAAEVIGPAPTD